MGPKRNEPSGPLSSGAVYDAAPGSNSAERREITTSGTPLGMCNVTPVSFTSGDPNNDKILDPGETWVFSCQGSLAGPTTDTGSASQASAGVGHGIDITGDDITKCAPNCTSSQQDNAEERDSLSVTITNNARG